MVSGYLCAQLRLQFYAISFETFQCFCHSRIIYARGFDIILRLFFFTFPQFELSHFSDVIAINVCRQRVPCKGNYYNVYFFQMTHYSPNKILAGDIDSQIYQTYPIAYGTKQKYEQYNYFLFIVIISNDLKRLKINL